ncbi:pyrroline-5-carboxylate reductase [Marinomonas sp.]|uniref:pyrroline-5-carboxylate reductase n=1 Tax=Marinomonas sp. TaxID=1904862 RepID=UPI003C708AC5
MKIGFIGTGVISDAIVRGLMKSDTEMSFLLSRRSASLSERLANEFSNVEVVDDNQAIIDASDVVVLAVRPQVAEAVLAGLTIPPEKQVISLIATLTHETLRSWFGTEVSICRAIPLPFVADQLGITAIYPDQAAAKTLFTLLGTVVAATSQVEFDRYGIASATMGLYFETVSTLSEWIIKEGVPESHSQLYFSALLHGLNQTALKQNETSFRDQVAAHSTPGGLNEQAVSVFKQQGGPKALVCALESIKARILANSAPNSEEPK